MIRSRWLARLLLALLVGGALFFLGRLLVWRFEAGDVYAPYSSLRADPLGTKVLFTALQELPGATVERDYLEKALSGDLHGTVVFIAGAGLRDWTARQADKVHALARAGARVVVALRPMDPETWTREEAQKKQEKQEKKKEPPAGEPEEKTPGTLSPAELDARFDLKLRLAGPGRDASRETLPLRAVAPGPATEEQLSWHSFFFFSDLAPAWRPLYRCRQEPVLVERSLGEGSLVLATDSYFLSNEAMGAERAPKLLAALLAGRRRVLFEEAHLGVVAGEGIALLARKYRLEGLAAGLALLALLFVWQAAVPFLPPRRLAGEGEGEVVPGQDAASGFIALLRHSVPPARLLPLALEQWQHGLRHRPGREAAAAPAVQALGQQHARDPVTAWRAIFRLLQNPKPPHSGRAPTP